MRELMMVLILWGSFPVYASEKEGGSLSAYKWQNRVVLFNKIVQGKQLKHILEQHKADINQRDIIWFMIEAKNIHTNSTGNHSVAATEKIMKRFNVSQGEMVLIGKDGTLKFRTHHLNMDELFSVIDAMPMRQREMQHQRIQYDF